MVEEIFIEAKRGEKDILSIVLSKDDPKEFLIWSYYYIFKEFPAPDIDIKGEIKNRLLYIDRETFLDLAYILILKRTIDAAGKKHYLKILSHSFKDEVLEELSKSSEAKSQNGLKFKVPLIKKIIYKLIPRELIISIRSNQEEIDNLKEVINGRVKEYDNLFSIHGKEIAKLKGEYQTLSMSNHNLNNIISIHGKEIEKLRLITKKPKVEERFVERVQYIQSAKKEAKRLFNREVDDFYILFENIFYNSNIVKSLQKVYLPYIKGDRVVDIGCGRGEFLELLKEHKGIDGIGIDINETLIPILRDKGFNVYQNDANSYLKENSGFDTIVALEVIEHLDKEYLEEFLKLTFDSLNSGGRVILETINPIANTGVGNFYMDLTHIKPLPAQLIAFWLEYIGFSNIEILYFAPVPEDYQTSFIRRNYQTYAVIGEKI